MGRGCGGMRGGVTGIEDCGATGNGRVRAGWSGVTWGGGVVLWGARGGGGGGSKDRGREQQPVGRREQSGGSPYVWRRMVLKRPGIGRHRE